MARRRWQRAASAHELLRGRQHEILWRSSFPAARTGFWRDQALRWHFTRVADFLRRYGAVLLGGRRVISRPWQSQRRSDGAASEQTFSLPCCQPRAAHSAIERRFCAAWSETISYPARRHVERNRSPQEPMHSLQHVRWIPLPCECEGGRANLLRRSGTGISEHHADDGHESHAPRDNCFQTRSDEGARRAQWFDRKLRCGCSSCCRRRDQFSRDIVAFGQRQTSERPGQQFRCRWAALHGPRELGADGAFEMPEPDRLPKNAFGERFLFRDEEMGVPNGPHLVRRKARRGHAKGWSAKSGAEVDARSDGQALARLLAHFGRSARPKQPGHNQSRRRNRAAIQSEQRGRSQTADKNAGSPHAGPNKVHNPRARMPRRALCAQSLPRSAHPTGRRRPSERYGPLRQRSKNERARPQLQGA